MIRAYLYHDPGETAHEKVRAFRLARLELAEHLADEEGVPNTRMASASEASGRYLLLEADGPEGRLDLSGLVLALDAYGASQSLVFEFDTPEERRYLDSLPGFARDNFVGYRGTLVPPLEPA